MIKKTTFDLGIKAVNKRYDIVSGRIICWTRAKSPGENKVFILSMTETGTKVDFQTTDAEDRGTPPLIARKRGLVVLILKEEFVFIKMKNLKISKIRIPKEIDHGPGADIETTFVTKDERFASFVYKTYSDLMIYVMSLQEPISITSIEPPENTKEMVLVGGDNKYLMTADRCYNEEPIVMRFYPLETGRYSDTVSIPISRPRTLEEANLSYQGKKKYVITDETVELFRLEDLKEAGLTHSTFTTSKILVKYTIPYCDISKYGVEVIFSEAREFFKSDSAIKKKAHVDNIICMIRALREQIMDLCDVYTCIVYHLNYDYAFEKYLEVVNIEELVVRDKLLTIFYSYPKVASGKQIVKALKKYSQDNGTLPFADEKGIRDLIMNRDKNLLLDDMTREILKMLIFSPTEVVIDGELTDPNENIVALPPDPPSLFINRNQTNTKMLDRLARTLLLKEPHRITSFRVHETKIRLDLTNGSPFSIALFEMISRVSDEDILEKYSILIYYKWRSVFKYALIYSIFFWILNVLAYLYMGGYVENRLFGIVICFFNILFISFEVKCLVSDPFYYMSEAWNLLDVLLHFSCIVASLLLMNKHQRLGETITNWVRLFAVVAISIRGITHFRVFGPLRYLIRMLLQVFMEMPPFLTVLTSVIFIWAFMWKLAPVLTGKGDVLDPNEELNFTESIQAAIGMMLGNTPDSEEDGSPLGKLKFVFVIIGNVVILVTLMNFLIAVISDTYASISEEKELYEVKELLTFIRDFDAFLLKINFAVKWEQKRFISMVKEEQDDKWETLQANIEEKLNISEAKLTELEEKIEKVQDTVDNSSATLEKKLSVLMRVLDPEGKVHEQIEAEAKLTLLKRPSKVFSTSDAS
jgi:hypothetical protein